MRWKHTLIVILGLTIVPTFASSKDGEGKGLIQCKNGAFEGYTLFAPLRSTKTYLIDMQGKVVHTWKSMAPPGNAVYLLGNGHLLRAGQSDVPRRRDGRAGPGTGLGR